MPANPYGRTPSRRQQLILRLLIGGAVLSIINFCYFFFQREFIGQPVLYGLLCFVLIFGLLRNLIQWYHYARISEPEEPPLTRSFSVDVLTTYFPGEPYEMIEETLLAIQAITYPHTTYLCDEANDPHLREFCARHGVRHVTRTDRTNAKAGNINNALRQATGELCLILDPDHIPQPDFLDRIVPHFQNEEVGFVQPVQAYYNKRESLVAKGAAQQTFHFYGPMMMSMHGYGTVNAIGANCTFRRAALDSIGGHAPGLAEDMHTAMLLYEGGWKSVYVPLILAKGLVPSTLTAYLKQQLKWSRGTFDLLVHTYPKIFGRLTGRQRLHFAMKAVHYLSGFYYLFAFLIPILSLFLSDVPWQGDFVQFLVVAAPVLLGGLVIRLYVQQWLIDQEERGFHIVGGVLEIIGWWIFCLGFIYTVIGKRIPYLPTPKDDKDITHPALVLPNIFIGVLSLAAVWYGLWRDFTPFSLMMAGFALFNSGLMFFSIYLAVGSTNRIGSLRSRLPPLVRRAGASGLTGTIWLLDTMTASVRKVAVVMVTVLLLFAFLGSMFGSYSNFEWVKSRQLHHAEHTVPLFGMFLPSAPDGESDLKMIRDLEAAQGYRVELVSSYFAWDPDRIQELLAHLDSIKQQGSLALVTWEPWVSTFSLNGTAREDHSLSRIADGEFDDYIIQTARGIRAHAEPVYLRFAHEFDNPAYPWSPREGNSSDDFIRAWRHVHRLFKEEHADNVSWVYNPWKAAAFAPYFPGRDYVDYLGITCLNYGPAFSDLPSLSFEDLYQPFAKVNAKYELDVLLAEFGTLGPPAEKVKWAANARERILTDHPEIRGVVYFNSSLDQNLPEEYTGGADTLDWYLPSPPIFLTPDSTTLAVITPVEAKTSTVFRDFAVQPRGIAYKKGKGYANRNYILSRKNIELDYERMRDLGLNTVKITDPGLYAHNLIHIAAEYQLGVIYSFWVDESLDFTGKEARQVEESVLQTVSDHTGTTDAVIAWDFGNDVLSKLSQMYSPKEAAVRQESYLRWLSNLSERIRTIDPRRPVCLTISTYPGINQLVDNFHLERLPVDRFGLEVSSASSPLILAQLTERLGGRLMVSSVPPDQLSLLPSSLQSGPVMMDNWQNQYEKGKLTYDGVLDFSGRRQPAFAEVATFLGKEMSAPELPDVHIVPPVVSASTGDENTYHAVIRQQENWVLIGDSPFAYTLEWSLIKNDDFGKPIALKVLGTGTSMKVELPEDKGSYVVQLTVTDGQWSHSVYNPLVPPL